jgi:hypothetical protein
MLLDHEPGSNFHATAMMQYAIDYIRQHHVEIYATSRGKLMRDRESYSLRWLMEDLMSFSILKSLIWRMHCCWCNALCPSYVVVSQFLERCTFNQIPDVAVSAENTLHFALRTVAIFVLTKSIICCVIN